MPWRHGFGLSAFPRGNGGKLGGVVHKKIIWLSEHYRMIGSDLSGLLLVVRTLKREVRASGECLGMYRR